MCIQGVVTQALTIGTFAAGVKMRSRCQSYRNLLFFRYRNIFGQRSLSEILLREYFSYTNFFINTHPHTHVQNAREGRGRVSSRCYCPSKIDQGCLSCVTSSLFSLILEVRYLQIFLLVPLPPRTEKCDRY